MGIPLEKSRLLCNSLTQTKQMLIHSPPLPLMIVIISSISSRLTNPEKIYFLHFSKQTQILYFSTSLDPCCWDDELIEALDRAFPTLETLSLSTQDTCP